MSFKQFWLDTTNFIYLETIIHTFLLGWRELVMTWKMEVSFVFNRKCLLDSLLYKGI